MTYSRTPSLAAPVTLEDTKEHLRVMHDEEDLVIQRMVLAAAREIEAYAEIALTRQTISLTVLPDQGVIALPIGPLAPDAEITVNGLPFAGTITDGRYPALMLTEWTDGPVTITYEAGFGDTAASVPDDLQMAIMEQTVFAFENRGKMDVALGLTPAAARICARYRRVRA